MNLIEGIWCRLYQTVFRIALPILPYREPERLSKITDVVPLLKQKNISSVLLVTDRVLRQTGITQKLESSLTENEIFVSIYDETNPNPTVNNVEDARALYLKQNCQAIIAFGGGSAMDCAKAAGARIAYPKKTMAQLKGLLKVLKKIPPLIAIPTTAGTGSEVTLAAVITDNQTKHKYVVNSFTLIPSYAVLDPELTYTLPPSLTATTGMDALTHAVEAYIGRSTTKQTRRMALDATRLIFENIEAAYQFPTDRISRENMLRASYLAGAAFTQSYVGYVHAVAHSLGGQYNIPHGLANAVLLPIVLEEYGPSIHQKLKELSVAAGIATEQDDPQNCAKKFITELRALNKRMNIPTTLSGIQEKDIPHMAKHAAKEANPLYPVPKLMNATELEIFYRLVSKEDRLS